MQPTHQSVSRSHFLFQFLATFRNLVFRVLARFSRLPSTATGDRCAKMSQSRQRPYQGRTAIVAATSSPSPAGHPVSAPACQRLISFPRTCRCNTRAPPARNRPQDRRPSAQRALKSASAAATAFVAILSKRMPSTLSTLLLPLPLRPLLPRPLLLLLCQWTHQRPRRWCGLLPPTRARPN